LLTNLETSERKLLQIVLIGQPELRTMLAQPNLKQLAQRVIARYHLGALTEAETAQYVQHRLEVAGLSQAMPFDARTMRRIHRLSHGVPRRINLLCDRALLGAYATGRKSVDNDTLDRAAREVFDETAVEVASPAGRQRAAWVGAGIAAGVAVAIAAWLVFDLTGRDAPTLAEAGAAPAVAAPAPAAGDAPPATAAADAPPASTPPAPAPFDLPTGFAGLVGAERDAWSELARAWDIQTGDGDPCLSVQKQQLRCFRTSTTLALIRQLDRPGILTLRDAGNRTAYVMLSGLTQDRATLQVAGEARSVSLIALADYWRGEYATLWREPPGYSGAIVDSRSGKSAQWLAQQLATVRGDPQPVRDRFDNATLKGWIHAFQLTQGLPSDGAAGPVTLMQLNRAIGVAEPRLQNGK
jgi:general secretion pathway protein A